jgi:hypothetical protein
MRNHVGALVGTDDVGDLVLDLLIVSLAPTTYNNYGTGMRRFAVFSNEEGITPLEATAIDMLRFTTWLARAGTVAANILQPYLSTTNKFFRDHLKEPVALGPLLTDARRGLAMEQQLITDPDIRVPFSAPIVQIEIEIEIVYNKCRQTGPTVVSRATLLRHTRLISKLGPGLFDEVHLSTHLASMCVDVPREL